MTMNPGGVRHRGCGRALRSVRFVCTASVPTRAYAEMSGQGPRSVLAAVTVHPVVGNGDDGVGESRSTQHQLTPRMAASG